jgi:hypothetical protein
MPLDLLSNKTNMMPFDSRGFVKNEIKLVFLGCQAMKQRKCLLIR